MDKPVPRNIVVSAVNLRKGGTLTVLRDCLRYLSAREDFKVTAIVHKRGLCDFPGIQYIEIPWSIDSWGKRLRCEYTVLPSLSKKMPEVDLWLSLHDTTPPVRAKRQAVYCHSSFPFMKIKLRDFKMDYKIPLFALLTKYIYRAYHRRNSYLVVQSCWLRDALSALLGFERDRIIVSPPAFTPMLLPENSKADVPVFIYPSTPDAHKGFETLCEAARMLEKRLGKGRFRVCVTISGEENRYARWIKKHWGNVESIDFHGFMSREELGRAFAESTCLVFPSRAETWGLPISEYLPTGKPLLLADLPYAHETAAGASCAGFFPAGDAEKLSTCMQNIIDNNYVFLAPVNKTAIAPPAARDWDELFEMLLK